MKATCNMSCFPVLTHVSATETLLVHLASTVFEVVNWTDEESVNGCVKESASFYNKTHPPRVLLFWLHPRALSLRTNPRTKLFILGHGIIVTLSLKLGCG